MKIGFSKHLQELMSAGNYFPSLTSLQMLQLSNPGSFKKKNNGKAMKILQVSAINIEKTVKIKNALLITVSIALFYRDLRSINI